jgi:hypothetical protein
MGITLTILILIAGAVAYLVSGRLVRKARVLGACLLMGFLAAIVSAVQNRAMLFHGSEPGASLTFEKSSEEDHHFLDSLLEELGLDGQKPVSPVHFPGLVARQPGAVDSSEKPNLKADLVINTAEVKRAELVTRNEVVRRAELVHHEKGKRPDSVRSRPE